MFQLKNQYARILRFPFNYLYKTSKRSVSPSIIQTLFALITLKTLKLKVLKNYIRKIYSNYSPSYFDAPDQNLPKINLLFVVHEKDVQLLHLAINFAIKNSKNDIHNVYVVATKKARNLIENKKEMGTNFVLIDEMDLIKPELLFLITKKFGSRAGWVIQQILKSEFVLSAYNGEYPCLQIDVDTILLNPQIWIDSNGVQALLESHEYHEPYYKFLIDIGLLNKLPKRTFIAHQMVFQPRFLKEIRKKRYIKNKEKELEYNKKWREEIVGNKRELRDDKGKVLKDANGNIQYRYILGAVPQYNLIELGNFSSSDIFKIGRAHV